MTKHIPIEYEEQHALVQWLTINRIMHFAPVNENNTHKQNRKYAMIAEQKAKAVGKRKGVSDLIVMLPNKILFIEMKRRPKILKSGQRSISHTKVSKEQYDFLTKVNGFEYAEGMVCYGREEAIEFIKSHKEG
ncbi:VRR-NUC domain-containing protein [Sulfurovum sp. XTW-4]|uniref:VRR-NUC domain-containing protein n=1 Tax=Sulfurovum xiamenensis TaxID=3019066 RepID=A0ABT7QVW7_9BACT|nr:VRR-NUC domain-containing protein [Sulfurovum xiamenensis]MDM5264694.1 VRR-NUC domain-containing protein [Sulfurovum xiamenensis]